jgi:branched-chain amino acid transport system permease protein
MDAVLFGQVSVNALMLGATYALIAVGLSIVFSIMRVIQFAHGHVYMLGAYGVYHLTVTVGVNYFAALIVTALAIGVVGIVIDRIFLRPLRGQDLPSMIVTLGLLLLIEGTALLGFGERDKRFQSPLDDVVWLFDAVAIPEERILILVVAVPLIIFLFLFVWLTKHGQAMRAVAQDAEAALLQGINIHRISGLGMFIGSALAAAAAGLVLPIQVLTPAIGGPVVIKAFMVVILGGLGSIPGAVLGAFAFGFIESFGITFFGGFSTLAAFTAVMLILIFRPQGLMGRV